jgi:hypothetical protein
MSIQMSIQHSVFSAYPSPKRKGTHWTLGSMGDTTNLLVVGLACRSRSQSQAIQPTPQPLRAEVCRNHEHQRLDKRRTFLARPAVVESRRIPCRAEALPTKAPDPPDKPHRHPQTLQCPVASRNNSDELSTSPTTILRKSHQRHAKDKPRSRNRELPMQSRTKFCSQSITRQDNERYTRKSEQVEDSLVNRPNLACSQNKVWHLHFMIPHCVILRKQAS